MEGVDGSGADTVSKKLDVVLLIEKSFKVRLVFIRLRCLGPLLLHDLVTDLGLGLPGSSNDDRVVDLSLEEVAVVAEERVVGPFVLFELPQGGDWWELEGKLLIFIIR
jgi:hypothetical protein